VSNDENSNDIKEAAEAVKETVEEVVETVKETVEDAVESVKETVDDIEESNAASKIMDLKESNPKVFFGAIAALVIVVLMFVMGGGSDIPLPKQRQVNLSIGNTYTLKGVNTTSEDAKVRLVAIPGSVAAYDESDEDGKADTDCKHIAQGTKVKLLQTQEAFGSATFVELEILGSDRCAGRKGWATSNNLS